MPPPPVTSETCIQLLLLLLLLQLVAVLQQQQLLLLFMQHLGFSYLSVFLHLCWGVCILKPQPKPNVVAVQ